MTTLINTSPGTLIVYSLDLELAQGDRVEVGMSKDELLSRHEDVAIFLSRGRLSLVEESVSDNTGMELEDENS